LKLKTAQQLGEKMETQFNLSEIFDSIQMEGFWTGVPATFLRFSGCNLACEWCDTPQKNEMLFKSTAYGLVQSCTQNSLIVMTGGEPTIQPIHEFVDELLRQMIGGTKTVTVETNGTRWEELQELARRGVWITFSPKIGSGGSKNAAIFDPIFEHHWANEIKVVWGTVPEVLLERCVEECSKYGTFLFIQPKAILFPEPKYDRHGVVNRLPDYTCDWKGAVEFVKSHHAMNIRLSIQGHKVLGIR